MPWSWSWPTSRPTSPMVRPTRASGCAEMAVTTLNAPRSIAGRALGNRSLMAGLVILGLIMLAAILAPWISPYDPNDQDPILSLGAPSATHWFGTDFFGR